MDPTGLLGVVVGVVGRGIHALTHRQRIVFRADTKETLLAYFEEGRSVIARQGTIRIYNGGPGRVTVNGAGWEAEDGTRVEAGLPSNRTVEPGEPEIVAAASPTEILKAQDEHGGLARIYVELAGSDKPHRRNLPKEWIGAVRELEARDLADSRRP